VAKRKIVQVDWVDSVGFSAWASNREHRDTRAARCVTVGMLARKDEQEVVVTLSVDLNNANSTQTMAIPRCAVRKFKVLATIDIA